MKSTIANWYLEINMECPHCDGLINFMRSVEYIEGLWELIAGVSCGTETKIKEEIECERCGEKFMLDKIEDGVN